MEYMTQISKPMIAPAGFSPKKVNGTPEQKKIRKMIEQAQVSCSGHRCTFKFMVQK